MMFKIFIVHTRQLIDKSFNIQTHTKIVNLICLVLIKQYLVFSDKVRILYVVRNNVEHLCNSNLLLDYVNLIMYK